MEMKDGFFCPSKVRAYILNLVYENDIIDFVRPFKKEVFL